MKQNTLKKEFVNTLIWENARISNDFIFGKVMQDAALCKELLQIILPDLTIDHIEYKALLIYRFLIKENIIKN